MKLEEIKNIPIVTYLRKLGIYPIEENKYRAMYLAPYRQETKPSLKVDKNKNLWIDFGDITKKGSIIDFVMILSHCNFKTALDTLANSDFSSFSFHCNESEFTEVKKNLKIQKIKYLENKALLQYLENRCINLDIAKQFCKEAYYTMDGKQYFAIAFENKSGGYELRNKYFKGCTSKDISTINRISKTLSIFEGFMDFLSYYSIKEIVEEDIIVLTHIAPNIL